ncbi:MAG TPA: hypothetical protein VLV88_14760 [Terriglobales bacterium]|nr:hypothetical protein [Terriglobales bacterium]
MWSDAIENLKKLNVTDQEVAEVVKLKQAGLQDDTCVELVNEAHLHKHFFNSAESVRNLIGAGFSEPEVLEIAKADKLDSISGDAVTIKLIGLSDATVQLILRRELKGQPTLSSDEIAKLKNTGLTERQIVERIQSGMTDAQAEKEVKAHQRDLTHSGFVRIHGRIPH